MSTVSFRRRALRTVPAKSGPGLRLRVFGDDEASFTIIIYNSIYIYIYIHKLHFTKGPRLRLRVFQLGSFREPICIHIYIYICMYIYIYIYIYINR